MWPNEDSFPQLLIHSTVILCGPHCGYVHVFIQNHKNPELRSCGPLSLLFNQWILSNFQTGNDQISKLEMIKFPNWKWSNFHHIHNMEITKFPIQGNFHISMAGYFQHGNYPISKMCMWKLSHFHGPLSPTWKYENFQCLEIFLFPWLPPPTRQYYGHWLTRSLPPSAHPVDYYSPLRYRGLKTIDLQKLA